jgi:hypothetical protein
VTGGRDELVLTSASRGLRRSVGPTAWVVLEALTADAVPHGDELVVTTSVRRLADGLGLGRDAVAGAVQALAFAGRLRVETSRDRTGRFGVSRYVVLPGKGLRRADASPTGTPKNPTNSRLPRREQLSLLDITNHSAHATSPATPPTSTPTHVRATRP